MQRQVLKEMEQQLQGSHQLTQLRAQVRGSSRGCWGWHDAGAALWHCTCRG